MGSKTKKCFSYIYPLNPKAIKNPRRQLLRSCCCYYGGGGGFPGPAYEQDSVDKGLDKCLWF